MRTGCAAVKEALNRRVVTHYGIARRGRPLNRRVVLPDGSQLWTGSAWLIPHYALPEGMADPI